MYPGITYCWGAYSYDANQHFGMKDFHTWMIVGVPSGFGCVFIAANL